MILMCDFSKGFKEPELVKERPVIVIATGGRTGSKLVTVVGLSTTEPNPIRDYHCKIDNKKLPPTGLFLNKTNWIKGDMIYTVGFHRLSLIGIGRGTDGKRRYYMNKLGRDSMREVYSCVLHGLNLGSLTQHL